MKIELKFIEQETDDDCNILENGENYLEMYSKGAEKHEDTGLFA